MNRPWLTVGVWVAGPPFVAAVVAVLGEVGSLGWPPAPIDWHAWIVAGDPAVVLAATMRLGVVVACALTSLRVAAAILLTLVAGSTRRRHRGLGPRSLSSALTRIARPVAVAGLGIGVASSTVIAHPAAAAAEPSPSPASVDAPASTGGGRTVAEGPTPPAGAAPSFVEMRRVRIEFVSFEEDHAHDDEPETWVVDRGDHLWAIATETLTDHLGEPPSERRVARYWQRLIDANIDRFVIPGEPDVIMPGQRLVLPRPATGRAQRSGT